MPAWLDFFHSKTEVCFTALTAQSAFMTASEVRAPTFYRQEGLLMKNKQGEVCKGSYEMSAFFFFEFYSLGTSLFKSAGTYLSVGKAVTAPSKVLNN